MKKITLLLATLLITIFSCNKIDTTNEIFTLTSAVEVSDWNPEYAATVVQKIYVEEFTGHTCTYCPAGAQILHDLMEEDPTIVATAIHCTFQANPGNPPFDNNYKTPMGDLICEDFAIMGIPKATINRMKNDAGQWGIDRTKWRSTIEGINRNNVRAGIQLHCTVDESKQTIDAQVSVTIIKELPNPVQLCLILQEDGIISAQKDGSTTIYDYEHNHVLRAGFNGNYGTKLTADGMVTPQLKYSTTFRLTYGNGFPYSQTPPVIQNCSIIAYLLDMVTKEVVQVERYAVSGVRLCENIIPSPHQKPPYWKYPFREYQNGQM